MAHQRRIRGKPFPFVVEGPQSSLTLDCCIAYNKYGAYCVPVSGSQRPAALRVLAGDVWEVDTIDFMSSHYAGGDIVHAGTFFGDFLPPLSRLVTQGSQVWAFEPHSESYRCAKITIEINQLGNVRIMNAGLGERSEAQTLVIRDVDGVPLGGASYIVPDRRAAWNPRGNCTELVQIVRIDDVVPEDRTVSMIQLDVEGYERHALMGALRTIRQSLPTLILETLPDEEWIARNLTPLGYREGERVPYNVVLACT